MDDVHTGLTASLNINVLFATGMATELRLVGKEKGGEE